MRRMGWMTAVMIACLCFVGVVASASTSDDGFDGLVHALDTRCHARGKGVPLMWAVSLIARGATGGGVRGMRVVTYERLPADFDGRGLDNLVRARMGVEWAPMVRTVHVGSGGSGGGETTLVYTRPAGKRIQMLVVDMEPKEMNLVRMELSPEALAHWEQQH